MHDIKIVYLFLYFSLENFSNPYYKLHVHMLMYVGPVLGFYRIMLLIYNAPTINGTKLTLILTNTKV